MLKLQQSTRCGLTIHNLRKTNDEVPFRNQSSCLRNLLGFHWLSQRHRGIMLPQFQLDYMSILSNISRDHTYKHRSGVGNSNIDRTSGQFPLPPCHRSRPWWPRSCTFLLRPFCWYFAIRELLLANRFSADKSRSVTFVRLTSRNTNPR